jgi:hypothetical protein
MSFVAGVAMACLSSLVGLMLLRGRGGGCGQFVRCSGSLWLVPYVVNRVNMRKKHTKEKSLTYPPRGKGAEHAGGL